MRQRWILLVLPGLLLVSACASESDEGVASNARPAVDFPIGPSPGPAPAIDTLANPFEGSRVAIVQGRKLFVWYNCYGCHGDHGGGGMGPSLRDVTWLYGNSDPAIFSSIAQGRTHGMPAWGTKLPEEQIWKLVAYIDVMGTELEPDPPPPNPSWPLPTPVEEPDLDTEPNQ